MDRMMTETALETRYEYPVTLADIEAKRAEYAAITCDTPAEYEVCRLAIANCRTTRVAIEERRVELKAASLAYGRRVDATARELTTLIEHLEEPLKAKKLVVDTERDRVKREAEEAELRAIEERVHAERDAEEARLRAERQLEEERLAVERERQAEERVRLDAEREAIEAQQRAERERLDAERMAVALAQQAEANRLAVERARLENDRILADEAARKERESIAAERREAERVEFERQATIHAEAEAKAQAERHRIAADEARVAEAERQETARTRLAALRPDAEKLAAFASVLEGVAVPKPKSREAKAHLAVCVGALAEIVASLRGFANGGAATLKAAE